MISVNSDRKKKSSVICGWDSRQRHFVISPWSQSHSELASSLPLLVLSWPFIFGNRGLWGLMETTAWWLAYPREWSNPHSLPTKLEGWGCFRGVNGPGIIMRYQFYGLVTWNNTYLPSQRFVGKGPEHGSLLRISEAEINVPASFHVKALQRNLFPAHSCLQSGSLQL